jgi:adenylate kinase
MRRPDDNAEALINRLDAYHKQTIPVTDYYAKKGLYKAVDASLEANKVHENLVSIFSELKKKVLFDRKI